MRQFPVKFELPGVEQALPHDRVAEIAVRLLDQRQVQVFGLVAQEGERILVAAPPLDFAGMRQQAPRLSEQVERHIGKAEVLLERGRMADPFAEPLREHEIRVRKAEHVAAMRRHSVFTSSGIS